MYCSYCGNLVPAGSNFCSFCGARINESTTTPLSLLDKAYNYTYDLNRYNLVLIDNGTCSKTTCGDLMEDIFGYTDAESTQLIRLMPIVIGENMTATEAATVAQVFAEYGVQVSITDENDKYVDLTDNAVSTMFDNDGNLLDYVMAIIGALTVNNRVRRYRRYRRPSLLERIFMPKFKVSTTPRHYRRFRPVIQQRPEEHRYTIRKPGRTDPRPAPGHQHRNTQNHTQYARPDHNTQYARPQQSQQKPAQSSRPKQSTQANKPSSVANKRTGSSKPASSGVKTGIGSKTAKKNK